MATVKVKIVESTTTGGGGIKRHSKDVSKLYIFRANATIAAGIVEAANIIADNAKTYYYKNSYPWSKKVVTSSVLLSGTAKDPIGLDCGGVVRACWSYATGKKASTSFRPGVYRSDGLKTLLDLRETYGFNYVGPVETHDVLAGDILTRPYKGNKNGNNGHLVVAIEGSDGSTASNPFNGLTVVAKAREYLGQGGKTFWDYRKVAPDEWCADFTWCIFDMCGYGNLINTTSRLAKGITDYVKKHGETIYEKGDPKEYIKDAAPGDVIGYSRTAGVFSHVEIVSEKPSSSSSITSIGGNTRGGGTYMTNIVSEKSKDSSYIYGIYRPAGNGSGGPSGTGNLIESHPDVLYTSAQFEYLANTGDSSKNKRDTAKSKLRQAVENAQSNGETAVEDSPENVTNIVTSTGEFSDKKLKQTRFSGNVVGPSLPTSLSLIEAPYIEITLGDVKIGTWQGRNKPPNYINALKVVKTNSSLNEYTISVVHQISPGDNPNYIDELLSKNGYNEMRIKYGDAEGGITYSDTKALLVDVQTNFDFGNCRIQYTLKATSSAVMLSTYKTSYPAVTDKPSNIIKHLLYGDSDSQLLDVFPGMQNQEVVEEKCLIPVDDKEVSMPAVENVSPLTYVKKLTSWMVKGVAKGMKTVGDALGGPFDVIGDVVYNFVIYDEIDTDLQGTYFKIVEIDSSKDNTHMGSYLYEVNVGYPDDAYVYDFKVNNSYGWAMAYNYTEEVSSDYNYDISDNGSVVGYSALSGARNWWSKMTQFPVSATLTTRGLLKPIELMTYIKINCNYFGAPRPSSGIYIVIGQEDSVSGQGFSSTLSLLKVAGDEEYINIDGRRKT